jgi:hypothetical protein
VNEAIGLDWTRPASKHTARPRPAVPESVESTSTTPAEGETMTMELPVRVRSRSM